MLLIPLILCACALDTGGSTPPSFITGNPGNSPTVYPFLPPTRIPGSPILTPTPDIAHPVPTLRSSGEEYVIQPGDTLAAIARRYGIDLNTLIVVNQIVNPDLLEVGQVLIIPPSMPSGVSPDYKIIPDSELVFGPGSAVFDISGFINFRSGYVSTYYEEVDGVNLSGAGIISRVALENSINPRLLLAVLEYQSGWVTQPHPAENTITFPLGYADQYRQGLYRQLSWAANNLNRGYYLWKINAIPGFVLTDSSIFTPPATINAGTAAIQYLFGLLYPAGAWQNALSENGVFNTYQTLFGYPFDATIDPLLPPGLSQPEMQLPFETGVVWSFTGGPHAAWGDGSAWASLDFAPPGNALGCVSSDAWVTAVADGLVVRSASGVVILDLDGDGFEQTGWSVLYLHIETRDRVLAGTQLHAGERIGHPSCEGGISNGTHVHLARRYNGEWISADGSLPFILDGWVSQGTGIEYDGYLIKNGQVVEAWDSRKPENQIQR